MNRLGTSRIDVDRITCTALNLQHDGAGQAGRVGNGCAGDPADPGEKLGLPRVLGRDLNLVGLEPDDIAINRQNVGGRRRPGHWSHGGRDIRPVSAEGGGLVVPSLVLREAPVIGVWVADSRNRNAVNMLMDVDGRGRTGDAIGRGGHQGDAGDAGSADSRSGIPGSGARRTVCRNIEGSGVAGRKLDPDQERLSQSIPGGRRKYLGSSHVQGQVSCRAQGDAFHGPVIGSGAAFADTAGEGRSKTDGQ